MSRGPRTPRRKARLILATLIVVSCIGCDRVTKSVAQATLVGAPSRSLLNGLITLTYTENPGAFLGLGAHLPEPARMALGICATLVILAMSAVLLRRAHLIHIPLLIGVSLLVGGGVGNLIDRVTNGGRVVDFMLFRVGPLQTGILNVADIAITAGAVAVAALTVLAPESHAGAHSAQA